MRAMPARSRWPGSRERASMRGLPMADWNCSAAPMPAAAGMPRWPLR